MNGSEKFGDVAIYPLRYTAADLQKVPEDDAVFFLMCGQLHNDVVILLRQVIQARRIDGAPEPLNLAAATASNLNIRMLAGRLAEGWPLIKDRFQKLFLDYGPAIRQDAKDDLLHLKRYFSDENLIRKIRNKVVSHLDQDIAREAFSKLSTDEPLMDFHARMEGNTLFFSGEALMLASIHHLTDGAANVGTALDAFVLEVLDIARLLGNVVRAYLKAFSERHLGMHLAGLGAERVVIEGQRRLSAFRAPIFLAHDLAAPDHRQLFASTSVNAISAGLARG